MNLDIVIIAIILISILVGLLRGITKEIFSLLSIFCGIITASRYYQKLSFFFISKVHNEILANIISFVVIFLLVSLFISLIGMLLCKIWRILHLGLFDRIFGAVFGLIRGLVLVALVAILIEKFPIGKIQTMAHQSFLFPFLSPLRDILLSLFPFSFFER